MNNVLTQKRRWKPIAETTLLEGVPANSLALTGHFDIILPSSTMLFVFKCRNVKANNLKIDPAWIELKDINSDYFISLPIDFQSNIPNPGCIVSSYIAGGLISFSNYEKIQTPKSFINPGMGNIMFNRAIQMDLIRVHDNHLYLNDSIKKIIKMFLDNDEEISLLGTDEKIAICRSWIENKRHITYNKNISLSITRLIRSMTKEIYVIESRKTNKTTFYSLCKSTNDYKKGFFIDNNIAWSRVKSNISIKDFTVDHSAKNIEDDNSYVFDGIYIRDNFIKNS